MYINYNLIMTNYANHNITFYDLIDILHVLPRQIQFRAKMLIKQELDKRTNNIICPNCDYLNDITKFIANPKVVPSSEDALIFKRLSDFEFEKHSYLDAVEKKKKYLGHQIDMIVISSLQIEEKINKAINLGLENRDYPHVIRFIMEVMIPFCLEDFEQLVYAVTTKTNIISLSKLWKILIDNSDLPYTQTHDEIVNSVCNVTKLLNDESDISKENLKELYYLYIGKNEEDLKRTSRKLMEQIKDSMKDNTDEKDIVKNYVNENEIREIINLLCKPKKEIIFDLSEDDICSLIIDFGKVFICLTNKYNYIHKLTLDNVDYYLFRINSEESEKYIYGITTDRNADTRVMRMERSRKRYYFDEFK